MKDRAEFEFLPAALEVRDTPPHPASRVVAWVLITFFCVAVAWASVGEVDVVAVAPGKIIASGRTKLIQSFEAGIVQRIHVENGQLVRMGDILIELDPTVTRADEHRLHSEREASALNVAQLKLLRSLMLGDGRSKRSRDIRDFITAAAQPQAVADSQRMAERRHDEYSARIAVLDDTISGYRAERATQHLVVRMLEATVPIVTRRAKALESLQASRLASEHEYWRLEQERIEKQQELAIARSRIVEVEAKLETAMREREAHQAKAHHELLERLQSAERERVAVEKEYLKSRERNRRRILKAPVSGVIQQLAVHTVGGVVTPAQELLKIVPKDSRVEIEAWLENKDIGFVHEGQTAEVKVETFPFTRYGVIDATVKTVSKDAIPDERRGLVYAARASLARTSMNIDGNAVNLTPGMAVSLEVKTGKRKIIEYLLTPIIRGFKESTRER